MKLGLVGAGRWGRRFIETAGDSLVVVASRNPETRSLVRCRVVDDWQEALEGVDAVIVATPPSSHVQVAAAAVERGLPVLVEKPLSLDLAQARSLLRLAERKKACVLVDHVHLFSLAWERFQAAAGKLGGLKSLRTEGGNWGPFREDVGPLWDYGPHDVSFCLAVARRRVKSVVKKVEERREGGETVRLALGFGDGLAADIRVSNIFPEKRRLFEAVYEKGPLRLEHRPDDEPPLKRALARLAESPRDLESLRLGVDVVEVLSSAQG